MRLGFAVPTSKPRYTCRESATMMVAGTRSASQRATALFPAAVGPAMTGMRERSSSAKASLELFPRKVNYCRATMDVVGRQLRGRQRGVKAPHLAGGHEVARLDCRLAGNCCGEPLMTRSRGGVAIARDRGQRLSETALGVEA